MLGYEIINLIKNNSIWCKKNLMHPSLLIYSPYLFPDENKSHGKIIFSIEAA